MAEVTILERVRAAMREVENANMMPVSIRLGARERAEVREAFNEPEEQTFANTRLYGMWVEPVGEQEHLSIVSRQPVGMERALNG